MTTTHTPGRVCVLGSANVDDVREVDRFPRPGETVFARSRTRVPGGKGLNQAIAAARAGAATALRARIGADEEGRMLRAAAAGAGVDTAGMLEVPEATGSAAILRDGAGENSIVVAGGANAAFAELTADDLAAVAIADILLLQGEVPLAVLEQAAVHARGHGTRVVLTPAPVQEFGPDLFSLVDLLVPNEHEACALAGLEDPRAAARALAGSRRRVLITLGGRGAALVDPTGTVQEISSVPVRAVDTTGAGDAFCGALAARLAAGAELPEAARWAAAAAALSVTREGSATSPAREEVEQLLDRPPV